MIRFRFFLPLLALLLMATSLSAAPYQDATIETFSNGHTVQEPFLSFYRKAPDPELLFGMPITEAFERSAPKKVTVQFFERARMEYDPTLPPDKQVYLADIGSWLYDTTDRGEAPDFPVNNSVCRSFQSSGYMVCYAFLQFYDRYNGPAYFGQPISNVEIINGRMVQYFERARMEWHTEMPVGQRVTLTEIGQIDFGIRIGNKQLLLPPKGGIIEPKLVQLQAYAFVEKPLLTSGESQKLYVVVKDQYGRAVPDAQVTIALTYPDNHPDNMPSAPTNGDGVAEVNFVPDNTPPNQMIKIEIKASIPGGTETNAWTWFRTWW